MCCWTCVSPLVGKFERRQLDFCRGVCHQCARPNVLGFSGPDTFPLGKKNTCAETVKGCNCKLTLVFHTKAVYSASTQKASLMG